MLDSSSSRKGKDRLPPRATDLAERVYALQRERARTEVSKSREKPEKPSSSSLTPRPQLPRPPSPRRSHAPPIPNPNIVVSHPSPSDHYPDEQDFSLRLKISPTSPRASHSKAQNSSPVPPSTSTKKLYNPDADPVRRVMITAEPDNISDGASSAYAPRVLPPSSSRSPQARVDQPRLFDPRKDNPHKFAAQARPPPPPVGTPNINGRPTPTPKSSGDYVSASSTSSASYAQSTISSSFTLSSATTGSSASSALFEGQRRSEDSVGPVNALSVKLKKLYRTISALEDRVAKGDEREREEEVERDAYRVGVLMKGRSPNGTPSQEVKGGDDEVERDKWRKQIAEHKELADHIHHMLTLTSAPTVPLSLRSVPIKYHLIFRLWNHAFHRLLENLRRAASPPFNSIVALEHLQDFIYYAYAFYGYLLEERNLATFRGGWVEALGDLARYRILVSKMVENTPSLSHGLPASVISRGQSLASAHLTPRPGTPMGEISALSEKASPTPAARIDDSPPPSRLPQMQNAPSVGIVAARLMELEPEKERWRQIAKSWYAKGLATTPGAGKLHHHLGLLSREKEGGEEDLRGIYHFVKSMICLHPFTNSRESIIGMWSSAARIRRQSPDARSSELFVLLHEMLFTNIQLDDFNPVLARFEEKLLLDGGELLEEREWIMMAVINLGAILEYGRPNAILRRITGLEGRPIPGAAVNPLNTNSAAASKVKLMVAKRLDEDDKKMDVDGEEDGAEAAEDQRAQVTMQVSPVIPEATPTITPDGPELPTQLRLALQLAFAMLSHTLRKPTRPPTPFGSQTLNPYITIVFTFLATILKDRQVLAALERTVPWEELAAFLNTLSRRLLSREQERERSEGGLLLTSGCSPLPEDWCLRGLGWGGKKVYERGFWGKEAVGEEDNIEMEVLDRDEAGQTVDGIIEDEDGDDKKQPERQQTRARWVRVARAALKVAKAVPGFVFVPPRTPEDRGEWRVEGVLADKVAQWREEDRRVKEAEERRLRGTRWDDDGMEVDDDQMNVEEDISEDSEDDDQDSEEVKALKARRRYLRNLLQPSQRRPVSSAQRHRERTPRRNQLSRPLLRLIPGHTILVFDTNILLSSLSIFSSLVESLKWTIVVPLPVIMELDGLASNATPLGEAASAATSYIISHLRSHSMSLKVQTSKGNYLNNLSIRTENIEWNNDQVSWERNVDDLILRAAVWQTEHWVDRSTFSAPNGMQRDNAGASKVVLVSFDRMLRIKARSRDVDAASEQDIAAILASVS